MIEFGSDANTNMEALELVISDPMNGNGHTRVYYWEYKYFHRKDCQKCKSWFFAISYDAFYNSWKL